CKMVEIHMTQLQSQASLSASSSSTQSAPPRIDETLITYEVLGVRRRYRRRVGPKLKRATSTSSTAASPPRILLDAVFDEQLCYMSCALTRLVPGFYMSIQQLAALDILPMLLPPILPPKFRSELPLPTSDT
ncbi:hypothetical protein PanWU01x14_349200, partial [Parasponia andersonii]